MGIQAGDPDSMISLADMIDRHIVFPSPGETKLELFKRAAQLGHTHAAEAYNAEIAKDEQNQQNNQVELRREEMARDMAIQPMGRIIQNIPMR
jgi:hypothetical protein